MGDFAMKLTTAQVAEMSGYSKPLVMLDTLEGKLTGEKNEKGRWTFENKDVEKWLAEKGVKKAGDKRGKAKRRKKRKSKRRAVRAKQMVFKVVADAPPNASRAIEFLELAKKLTSERMASGRLQERDPAHVLGELALRTLKGEL